MVLVHSTSTVTRERNVLVDTFHCSRRRRIPGSCKVFYIFSSVIIQVHVTPTVAKGKSLYFGFVSSVPCFLFALRITGVSLQELRFLRVGFLDRLIIRKFLSAKSLHLVLVGNDAVGVA
jgi:hypothetical protein